MPKRPRVKGANLYHHVYNRGNNRQPLFRDDSDYRRYLEALFRYSPKYQIKVVSYALMKWHVHLFMHDYAGEISQFMNVLHGFYAQVHNKIHGRLGHVFECRFKNKIVDADSYGLWLTRYIHRQPVEAGLVKRAQDYQWTSYRRYVGLESDIPLCTDLILNRFGTNQKARRDAYRDFVEGIDDGPVAWDKTQEARETIVGSEEFIKHVTRLVGTEPPPGPEVEDLLGLVGARLGVSLRVLRDPFGSKEKALRREAMLILWHDHRLGIRRLARLFNIAPSSVFKAVSKANKRTPAPR